MTAFKGFLNGSGHFAYTWNGTYVEWLVPYVLTDRPVMLNQQPKMVVTINGDQ